MQLRYDPVSRMQFVEFRCQRYVYDPLSDGFQQHDPSSSTWAVTGAVSALGRLHRDHEAFTELLALGGLRTGDLVALMTWLNLDDFMVLDTRISY
eukprot:s93_g25.t1